MQNPFWVASARGDIQRPLAWGNHTCALRVKEGRIGPAYAYFSDFSHSDPMIRPVMAKSASSQGEALALARREYTQTHPQTQSKDMKMEFSS